MGLQILFRATTAAVAMAAVAVTALDPAVHWQSFAGGFIAAFYGLLMLAGEP